MSKRILSLVLTLALVLGSFSMAFAETGATTAGLTPAEKIAKLQELLFVEGDENGNLNLDKSIKRSEVAVIAAKAAFSGGSQDMDAVTAEIKKLNYAGQFSDVKQSDWANAFVNAAVSKGIISGYPDGTFKPAKDIKYKEVITMMVGLAGEQPNEGKYPGNYITKAMELGLLDGVDVDYEAVAQRQGVFEILFNTVTQNKVGNYNIDKVIVLENNRVESIGTNEIVVEVISEVQRANVVRKGTESEKEDAKKRIGQQLRITVPASAKLDVEGLLGKVVDLSYDKQMNAVNAQEDKSYTYVQGPAKAEKNRLTVDGKSYTASLDERYEGRDERVYRTYFNDKAYAYADFYKNPTTTAVEDEFKVDFAKATIKNGKVVFVESYNFEDVAPVKEVKKEGTELFVYNDSRDGDVKRVELNKDKTKVVAVEKGQFSRIDVSKIDALDVVHVYGENKVIVRKDAKLDGAFTKVSEDKDGYYVTIADKAYDILDVTNKKAVYSYDSEKFYTLNPKEADKSLREFKDEKVTTLLDVSNNVQYFGSNIELGEFVSAIDAIVGKDVRVVKADNSKAEYVATLDSKFKTTGTTAHNNLNQLNKQDVAYTSVNDKNIDKIYTLVSKTTATSGNRVVAKDAKSNYIVNKNFIEFPKVAPATGNDHFKVLDRTNVFYYDGDKVFATTIEKVEKEQDKNKDLKAYVVTDSAYDTIVGSDAKRSTTGLSTVANTIVFTEVSFKEEFNKEKVEVTDVIASGYSYQLKVKDVNGSSTTRDIEKDSDADRYIRTRGLSQSRTALIGSVVELKINKTDKADINDITVLIKSDAKVFLMKDATSNSGYRQIILVDANGVERKYWTNTRVSEFGNLGGTSGSKISFSVDTNGEIDAIKVRPSNSALSTWDGTDQATGAATLKADFALTSATINVNERTTSGTVVEKVYSTPTSVIVRYADGTVVDKSLSGTIPAGTELNLIKVEGTQDVVIIEIVSFPTVGSNALLNKIFSLGSTVGTSLVLDNATLNNGTVVNGTINGNLTILNSSSANVLNVNSVTVNGETIVK